MSLFQEILGNRFNELPDEVKRVHDARERKTLKGRCDVVRGEHWLVAPIAWVASLPNVQRDAPITVTIERQERFERWCRNFDGHQMNSRLWRENGGVAERLGPLTFRFALRVVNRSIEWRTQRVSFLGMPLPLSWFSGTQAVETSADGRYTFDVRAALPIVGTLVRYRGWLSDYEESSNHRF